ncbi:ankyrin repeat and SOCS box protein 8-like [Haliotis asinina]|uniref:ankyrin repeat and SOCS box protein 8-like n=1 Tax=Haliotis asinina TaxID=109174 RepID=UPI00353186C7
MWYVMESAQQNYHLSERLIRAISNWRTFAGANDDVEHLIDLGADVNGIHGTLLPLHCACMVSDSNCLRLLLQKGARVNEVDGYGRTALHYAAERDIFCVEVLMQYGADLNAGDGNQDTPLHWAAYKNNVACVKLLLQNGADVDGRDYNEDTPLAWAARKGHLEIIKILLEYNANVDRKNLMGDTPLIRAASIQASGLNTDLDDAVLELLIKASGQFDLRNNKGELIGNIGQDNKMTELLLPLCKNTKKLQDLCRHCIRRCLGYHYLPNKVPTLPLPLQLRDYILLRR